MAMFYYYIDYDYAGKETKKGPYTLEELRALNLPVDTKIWSDGWDGKFPISECPEVMEYFSSTTEAKVVEVHPEMHWILRVLMWLGIFSSISQFVAGFINDSALETCINVAIATWGVISILGILFKKRWGLISYFSYRFLVLLGLIWGYNTGISSSDYFIKEFISLIVVCALFFIRKDGHNAYELLWNNGVFYEIENQSEALSVETQDSTNDTNE